MVAEISCHTFEDVDFFREVLRGWDTEPTQLTSARLLVCWDQLAYAGMTISRLRTNLRIADRTSYQADHFGFVICLGAKVFCGRRVEAGSLVLFGPGREYRNVLDENWESFEVSMALPLLRSLSFADEVARRIASGPEFSLLPLSPRLAGAFRTWSKNFLAPFRTEPGLGRVSHWINAVRERTLGLLAQVFRENGHVGSDAPHDQIQGWALAARALDYVDHHDHEGLTVQQIGQELSCTSRAIQMAFHKAVGISPYQYLLARRLHRARSDLLFRTNGPPVVTRTAAQHGFLHFGRFAQHYQRLFGERPSDTVMRARKRIVLESD